MSRPRCETKGCGRPIPVGGEGDEICPACLNAMENALRDYRPAAPAPIPMRLVCEGCGELHIDEGEFATKPHHTHSCQHCGLTWRPAVVHTVGVRFLPGFKNDPRPSQGEPPQGETR